MIKNTEKYIKLTPNVITEASFTWDNNFCSVDILKNDVDGVEIYEVKSSTELKDVYIDDTAYQAYVLFKLGYNVKKVCVVYVNNEYVRHGNLNIHELFKIEDVTDQVMIKQEEIEENIVKIREYMVDSKERPLDIGMHCFNPYSCIYWKYCSKHLPENNIFKISGMRKNKMFELYNKGIYSFEDLVYEDLNPKYKQQVEVEVNNKPPHIDKDKIREFMSILSYPIYFLDFETYQQPIPEYDGMKPYMQIPFQYSLHYILEKDGKLEHKEYLAEVGTDPRREFAESLVKNVPQDTCVLAYNMSFEKGRIRELAEEYEDLKEQLMNIHDNIKDLMIPFFNRLYYSKEMEGSYSIKHVLPALFPNEPELDYNSLSVVHKGDEASAAFLSLKEKTREEQEYIRKCLLEYCKLDTLAMVKIWEKLNKI